MKKNSIIKLDPASSNILVLKGKEVVVPPRPFEMLIRTTTTNEVVVLPTALGTNDYEVLWGDGNVTTVTTGIAPSNTYATPGDYNVRIDGTMTKMKYVASNNHIQPKIVSVTNLDCPSLGMTNTEHLFSNTIILESLSGLNFSGVTSMEYMFYYSNKSSFDVLEWDISSVTNMDHLFYDADTSSSPLTITGLSDWDVSSVTNMEGMFGEARATTIDIPTTWDTSNVTTMELMFYFCTSLTTINLEGLEGNSSTNRASMFYYCESLPTVDVSGLDVSNNTTLATMFYNCTVLTTVGDLSGWDMSNITDVSSMFKFCTSITDDAEQWWVGNPQITSHGSCFHDNTARPNYGDIPADWKNYK